VQSLAVDGPRAIFGYMVYYYSVILALLRDLKKILDDAHKTTTTNHQNKLTERGQLQTSKW
jgi:hypothetical protein